MQAILPASDPYNPSLSKNGGWVAFTSDATDLVAEAGGGVGASYVRALPAGTTRLIFPRNNGTINLPPTFVGSAPAVIAAQSVLFPNRTDYYLVALDTMAKEVICQNCQQVTGSDDLRTFAFVQKIPQSTTLQVVVLDRVTKKTNVVTANAALTQFADGSSSDLHLSGDGRFLVLRSRATNLAPGDANGFSDVFLYNTETHTMDLISKNSQGSPGNSVSSFPVISADGSRIAFESFASDFVGNDYNGLGDAFVFNNTAAIDLKAMAGYDPIKKEFTIQWKTEDQKRYRVEFKNDLSALDWSPLQTEVTGDGTVQSRMDSAGETARFYRVTLINP